MDNRVLITGITGQYGAYLAKFLLDKGYLTIGENTIIGADSVVLEDIPDNVVAAGAPAKVIRKKNEHDE